jgi:hypothetical protein
MWFFDGDGEWREESSKRRPLSFSNIMRYMFSLFVYYLVCGCLEVSSLIQGEDDAGILPPWQSVLSDESSSSSASSKNTTPVIRLFRSNSSRREKKSESKWTLHSADGVYQNLSAHVPGDLLTDLMKSGIIDDPYYGRNWLTQRRIWMGPWPNNTSINNNDPPPIPHNLEPRTRTWVYSTTFRLASSSKSWSYMLVIW